MTDDASPSSTRSGQPGSYPPGSAVFATTHWSVVVSARATNSPRSAEALETLCKAYWKPLYAYVRRTGKSPADAEDLTQAFFAKLLEKGYLLSAEREKGRFRSFLLTALKRFMANEWDREHRQKRGGFAQIIPIDMELAESRLAAAPAKDSQPDLLFDRQWAQTLLGRTLDKLRQEYVASGRAELYDHVQNCLAKEESALPYAQIGRRLKLSEAAVKMAVYRLRARFRDLLYEEVSQTVASAADADDEVRILFSSF